MTGVPTLLSWYRTIEHMRDRMRCAVESDRRRIVCQFEERHGYPPDLEDPKTWNEKLQWMKLYDRNPLYTQVSDKYRMREFVADIAGERYLVPLLCVHDDARKIDFDALPSSFIIKANHGSGWNLIVRDKKIDLDRRAVVSRCNKWLAKNYYVNHREWQYKNISPLLVVEELLLNADERLPADYKTHCFDHGRGELVIGVDRDRPDHCKRDHYDAQWNKLDVMYKYPQTEEGISRPDFLEEMVGLARRLAVPFPYVRVDMYAQGDRICVGELTITPGSGCDPLVPESVDLDWGSRFRLRGFNSAPDC